MKSAVQPCWLAAALTPAASAAEAPYDLVLRNARIVDGTGSPWYRGDLAIRGDTIAHIAPAIDAPREARDRREGRGRRAGLHRPPHPRGARHLRGADRGQLRAAGRDDDPRRARRRLARAAQALSWTSSKRRRSRSTSAASSARARCAQRVVGLANRAATPDEIGAHARARRAGHARRRVRPEHRPLLRSGHVHAARRSRRAAESREPVSRRCTRRTCATRPSRILDSVKETIAIGEQGGVPTQISHHKVIGKANWGRTVETLRLVDEARARGVDATIDLYPYTASSTTIHAALMPAWALEGGPRETLKRLGDPGDAREDQGRDRGPHPQRARRRRPAQRRRVAVRMGRSRSPARTSPSSRRRAAWSRRRRTRPRSSPGSSSSGGCRGVFHAIGRGRPAAHHRPSRRDDRLRRRGADLRARRAASAQLRHVRARARGVRAREEAPHARRRGAQDVVVSRGAHRPHRPRRAAARHEGGHRGVRSRARARRGDVREAAPVRRRLFARDRQRPGGLRERRDDGGAAGARALRAGKTTSRPRSARWKNQRSPFIITHSARMEVPWSHSNSTIRPARSK